MKRTFIYMGILFFSVLSAKARTVEMTLYPTKAAEAAQKHRLLPGPEEQIDSDAVALYEKAIQSLPRNYDRDKISRWSKAPLRDLPIDQAESVLQKFNPALGLLKQAGLCKKCNWPAVTPGPAKDKLMKSLGEYRQFAFILAVQARVQMAQHQYDQAIGTMRTGFAVARHLAEAPTLIQGMVGAAVAALMCQQVEQFVQEPDAPNLYWGLQSLPKPLVDLNKQLELEMLLVQKHENLLLRREIEEQLKPAHERVRLLMKRLDRDVAALQSVEAIRLYAGRHDGRLPNELADVTEVHIPDNPATQKPFVYRRTDAKATLEAPDAEGAAREKPLRYELKLKQ
jgi:tetratricopeptide (TPR) repeat protein